MYTDVNLPAEMSKGFGKVMVRLSFHMVKSDLVSFATFSHGLPNNAPATVLPVLGPPKIRPLRVWSPPRLNFRYSWAQKIVSFQTAGRTAMSEI